MITDEQIKQAMESAGVEFQYFIHARTNKQVCTTAGSIDFEKIASGIRAIIALAQQIKPLEWVEVSDALKLVKTVFGEYGVFISGSVTSAKFAGDDYYSRLFSTEAEAIEAANADYRKRVLSCLVNGGE